MSSLEPVGWTVPEIVRETFLNWVSEKHGRTDRYAAFEIEEAMRYYLDEDRGAVVEGLADALLEAAGLSREPVAEKTPTDERIELGHRVNPDLKQRFREFVDDVNDERDSWESRLTYGQALATAMKEHADGGRWGQVREKIERVRDDAEGLLAELDASSGDGLTTREKRTVVIANNLGEQFTHAELEDEISRVAGETVIDDYLPRVLDRLDYVESPYTRDDPDTVVYTPVSKAEEIEDERRRERKREAERETSATAEQLQNATPAAKDDVDESDDDAAAGGSEGTSNTGPPDPDELSSVKREEIKSLGMDPNDPDDLAEIFGGSDDQSANAERTQTPALTDGGTPTSTEAGTE